MAEIPVEKKSSMTWLWVLLALILAALLLWWLVPGDDDAEYTPAEDNSVEAVDTDTQAADDATTMTLASILSAPQSHVGKEFSGEVTVAGPLTDRGFWIEADNARMFAVIIDQPREVPLDINPGQRLEITGGTIREGGTVSDVEGVPLDDDTRGHIKDQDVFLLVDEKRINILERS